MTGQMTKLLGIALLVVGAILLVAGFNESHSFASDVSRAFTNSPTDRSLWFMIGGGASALVGAVLLLKKS
jgi:hypothetical protein